MTDQQSLLLAPLDEGLIQNKEAWLCPPNSFQELLNAQVVLGRITSRKGKVLQGTLPSKKPVQGIAEYLSLTSPSLVCWDDTTLYKYANASKNFIAVNTTPLNGNQYPIKSVMWSSPTIPSALYFIYPGKEKGIYKYISPSVSVPEWKNESQENINQVTTLEISAGRLLLFGTRENGILYSQRVRWSAIGNPEDFSSNEAGFADAATSYSIVCVAPIHQGVLVAFTEGLWLLEKTLDPTQPFQWRRLEARCKVFGIHAMISYGTTVKLFGERGIWICDGRTVERCDGEIPYWISTYVHNKEGNKVFCWEDALAQRTWMCYSSTEQGENTHALLYDHLSGAYSVSDEGYTVLGTTSTEYSYKWSDFSIENNKHWKIGQLLGVRLRDWSLGGNQKRRLAGDSKGNIWDIDFGSFSAEEPFTARLTTAGWNPYISEGIKCKLLYVDLYVECVANQNVCIAFYKDNERSPYRTTSLSLLPTAGYIGVITQVIPGSPTTIIVPQHGCENGQRIYIYESLGYPELNSTFGYRVQVKDENTLILLGCTTDPEMIGASDGEVFLYPMQKDKVWKRVYAQGTGTVHQMEISITGTSATYFVLHALKPTFKPVSRRMI